MPEVATPNQAEREFEVGSDEAFKSTNVTASAVHNENQRVVFSNIKRTFDAYQDLDLERARQAAVETARMNQIMAQAMQNAVESANMITKRAIAHQDLAEDSYWNPVSAGAGMNLTAGAVPANRAADVAAAGTSVSAEAVSAAVAKQVDATIVPLVATLQQIIQALTTATTSIANVVNQAQPKT